MKVPAKIIMRLFELGEMLRLTNDGMLISELTAERLRLLEEYFPKAETIAETKHKYPSGEIEKWFYAFDGQMMIAFLHGVEQYCVTGTDASHEWNLIK